MTYSTKTPAFRVIALALVSPLIAAAIPASAMDRDPTNQVPNWISESSFSAMSAYDIHEIDRAQKLGNGVIIGRYTVSESRDLVDEALNSDSVAPRPSFVEQRPFRAQTQHQGAGNR
ncbi:hypothetical protein [Roseovarius arcticus]|uniref:hypothetical protein n=1 Tax=Roseovarius arcticus TaxID=2547404 RepID=UPI00111032AA|nr:hypothetical protein [Roseovarius arcticus]